MQLSRHIFWPQFENEIHYCLLIAIQYFVGMVDVTTGSSK